MPHGDASAEIVILNALTQWLRDTHITVSARRVLAIVKQMAGEQVTKRFVAYPEAFWFCGYDGDHRSCYVFPEGRGARIVAYVNSRRQEVWLSDRS